MERRPRPPLLGSGQNRGTHLLRSGGLAHTAPVRGASSSRVQRVSGVTGTYVIRGAVAESVVEGTGDGSAYGNESDLPETRRSERVAGCGGASSVMKNSTPGSSCEVVTGRRVDLDLDQGYPIGIVHAVVEVDQLRPEPWLVASQAG